MTTTTTAPLSVTAGGRHLASLTPEQAEVIALRAKALDRFKARYKHRPESQRAMVGALRRLTTGFTGGRFDETTFPWELLVEEDLTRDVCSGAAEGYARRTAVKDASALRVMRSGVRCRTTSPATSEQDKSFTCRKATTLAF